MKNLLIPALLMATPTAFAQADSTSLEGNNASRLEFIKLKGDVKKMVEDARPSEPGLAPTPKFAVHSTDNKFIMTIGGAVNIIGGTDIGNNLYNADGGGIDFTTGAIPVPAVRDHKADWFINPLTSYLDFTIVGFGGTKNAVTAYLKLGTNGMSSQIKLKRAYISWRGFSAGEMQTMLQDGDACQPPTIDPEGPSGEVGTTTYQVSYKSPSIGGFQCAIGLEMPSYYSSNGIYRGHDYADYYNTQTISTDVEQMMPDIPAWIQYQFSEGNRLRLSGVFRRISYRDFLADKRRHTVGGGIMLSGNVTPMEALSFCFQGIWGKGIANYIQDIAGKPLSYTPADGDPGKLIARPMMGLVVGATVKATSKLSFNAMFSEARIWHVDEYATTTETSTDNYKYALYAAANCFYDITPYLSCGIEYVWGRRCTWDRTSAHDNRLQAQIQFSF